MTGGSTLGYSLIPKKLIPLAPNNTMLMDSTTAKTGRLIVIEDKLAISLLHIGDVHNHSWLRLYDTGGQHAVSYFQPIHNLYIGRSTDANGYLNLFNDVFCIGHKYFVAVQFRYE